jgi:signal transduction histidine kinase
MGARHGVPGFPGLQGGDGLCYGPAVDERLRNQLAAVTALVGLVMSLTVLALGRVDFGVTFNVVGDRVRIVSVNERSPAAREGFVPGMAVIELNGTQLLWLPATHFPEPDQDGNVPTTPPEVEPTVPTPVDLAGLNTATLFAAPVSSLTSITDAQLAQGSADNYLYTYLARDYTNDFRQSPWSVFAGVLILVVGAWWLTSGRAGAELAGIGVPLVVATATPLLVRPLEATWAWPATIAAGLIVPFAMGPLGLALAARITEIEVRAVARTAVIGCVAGAMLVGIGRVLVAPGNIGVDLVWGGLTAAAVLIPGFAAATRWRLPESASGSGRVLVSTELALAGTTPSMALLTGPALGMPLFMPLSLWFGAIAAANRFTIRPLARVARRATLQRDLVVAATEAERARVAADIHDDALQELTLLARRLDEAGDAEGADMARTVSDRLRAICGDLRLPILDDLGVGPALDWLVARIERLAKGEVRLERLDETRPPHEVELAFFRIAQEALGNAVKHGKTPIVVRYRATDAGASLSIDDAGAGIAPDAADSAEREGRYGLLNMAQRAEQIGAILDIRKWPSGGTHVALEWRAT